VSTTPPRAALVLAAIAVAAIVFSPQRAWPHELATAQGTIAIGEAAAGQRSPTCGELFVEARDALDNHLIARTKPATDSDGACRYALSVPAQSAVWLRLRPALVADARADAASSGLGASSARSDHHVSSRSVALRFTVISPNTYFFAPGEQKTVPLSY
jgi:hypothetical protein